MKPPISALKLIKPAGTVVSHLAEHTDSGVRGNKEAVFGNSRGTAPVLPVKKNCSDYIVRYFLLLCLCIDGKFTG